MKRRSFFKTAGSLATAPLFINGLRLNTFATPSMLAAINCESTDRVLVIIYLSGANDFINTFVPLDQHSTYAGHRTDLFIPETSLISLNDPNLASNQMLGLHPSLSGLKALYDEGKMNIVQGVGMPSPNRSHFKAKDLWFRGLDGESDNIDTGWIGRFLDNRYPYYEGMPFTGEPDPVGIMLGDVINTGFQPPHEHRFEVNLSGQDPAGFFSLISSIGGLPITNFPDSEYGDLLQFIMGVENNVNVYAERISSTFNAGTNSASVSYPNNNLADQLRTVARMLNGGSQTKVFLTKQGGYDTHAFQVEAGSSTTGTHANLLTDLSGAIKSFQDDLQELNVADKVLTVVFSEFGRKIVQNGNYGLDHGTLGSMIILGSNVNGGVTGNNLDLNALDHQNAPDPTSMQHDYRQVFGTIIQDWMGASDDAVQATFFDTSYISQKLSLVNTNVVADPSCYAGSVDFPVDIKIYLQGAYDAGTSMMRDDLRTANIIPTEEPFSTLSLAIDNKNAEIGTGVLEASGNQAVVDWVRVELRNADDTRIIRRSMAALVRRDGKVVDCADGVSPVVFRNVSSLESYEIAVHHRNHLGVMTNMRLSVP